MANRRAGQLRGNRVHHEWIVLAVARECKCLPAEGRPIPEAFAAAANSRTLGLLVGVGCEIGAAEEDANVPGGVETSFATPEK